MLQEHRHFLLDYVNTYVHHHNVRKVVKNMFLIAFTWLCALYTSNF